MNAKGYGFSQLCPVRSNAGHHLAAECRGERSSKGALNLWWRVRSLAVLARPLHSKHRLQNTQ